MTVCREKKVTRYQPCYQPLYEEVKRDYENHVETYHVEGHVKYQVEKYGLQINDAKCLDVGCGTSTVIHELSTDNRSRCVGLDSDAAALKTAKRVADDYNLDLDFVCGDAEELPFTDAYFNVVYSTQTLEHLENPEDGVREIARVLVNDGLFICSIPNGLGLGETIHAIFHRIRRAPSSHLSRIGYFRMKKLLSESGFSIREIKCDGILLEIIDQLILPGLVFRFFGHKKTHGNL